MKKENLRDGKLKFPANLVDFKLIDAGDSQRFKVKAKD